MTMPFIFKAAAQRNFDEAFDWYEKQEIGRGDLFAAEVGSAIEAVRQKPELHPEIYRDIRSQHLRV